MKRHAVAGFCMALLFAGLAWSQSSKDLDEKVKRARALYYDKEYAESLKMFDAVLSADQDNLEAQIGRLKALKGLKDDSAISSYDQKRSKTASSSNHVVSAQLKLMAGDIDEAEMLLKDAVKMDKKSYMAHSMLGSIYKFKKNYKGSVPHFLAAIDANKDYPETYFELGEAYFKDNNAALAAKYWRIYLEMVPRTGNRYRYVNDKLQKLGGN